MMESKATSFGGTLMGTKTAPFGDTLMDATPFTDFDDALDNDYFSAGMLASYLPCGLMFLPL